MRRLVLAITLSFTVTGACSNDSSSIEMRGRDFLPSTFRTTTGSTIVFTNDSDETHTVTALEAGLPSGADYFASGDFDSEKAARDDLGGGLIDPGDAFEVTLDEPGTYRYACLPHESQGMTGTIVVDE